MVICLERGANDPDFAYGSADATATPSSLALLKSTLVYLSGVSWYHCLPIGIYHRLGEGGCIAVVCEAVCNTEVRPGLSGKKMRWHFSEQR